MVLSCIYSWFFLLVSIPVYIFLEVSIIGSYSVLYSCLLLLTSIPASFSWPRFLVSFPTSILHPFLGVFLILSWFLFSTSSSCSLFLAYFLSTPLFLASSLWFSIPGYFLSTSLFLALSLWFSIPDYFLSTPLFLAPSLWFSIPGSFLSTSLFLAPSLWFSIPDLFLVLAPSFCFAPHWPLIKELGLQIKLSWNF